MKIVLYPHPALRHPAKPLAAIDKQVHLDAGRMLELMYEHKGLGLAANQVFLPYRIVVLNPSGDPQQRDKEEVLLNPVVLERKGAIEGVAAKVLEKTVKKAGNMKSTLLNSIWAVTLLAAVSMPIRLAAQEQPGKVKECSNAALQGSFGYTSTGTLISSFVPPPYTGPFR